MSTRLQRLKDLKLLVGELKEELSDESHIQETLQIMSTILLQIKWERTIGRQWGSLWWTVHIIMLICELLVNGNPPSAFPDKIQTSYAAITGSEVNEMPSLKYFRKCFFVVQNLNDMLAACLIRKERIGTIYSLTAPTRGRLHFRTQWLVWWRMEILNQSLLHCTSSRRIKPRRSKSRRWRIR